jgi:hypothetical protein
MWLMALHITEMDARLFDDRLAVHIERYAGMPVHGVGIGIGAGLLDHAGICKAPPAWAQVAAAIRMA